MKNWLPKPTSSSVSRLILTTTLPGYGPQRTKSPWARKRASRPQEMAGPSYGMKGKTTAPTSIPKAHGKRNVWLEEC